LNVSKPFSLGDISLGRHGVGGGIGYAVGGPVGAAIGAGVQHVLTDPSRLIKGLAYARKFRSFLKQNNVYRWASRATGSLRKPAQGTITPLSSIIGKHLWPKDDKKSKEDKFWDVHAKLTSSRPEQIHERISRTVGQAIDEETVAHASLAMGNAIAYLQSKLPQAGKVSPIDMAKGKKPPVDPKEMDKFLARVAVANSPEAAIEALESGKLTKEMVETLQAVYPRMYAALVLRIQEQIYDNPKIPYQNRVQLSVLLGQPMDNTCEPEFIAMVQSQFQGAPEGNAPGAASRGPVGKPKLNKIKPDRFTTNTEKLSGEA